MQDCIKYIANALELLQSCAKPSIWPKEIFNNSKVVQDHLMKIPEIFYDKNTQQSYACNLLTTQRATFSDFNYSAVKLLYILHHISLSLHGLTALGNIICFIAWVGDILQYYRQTSNIGHTLVGNKIVDHPDVVGASPVGNAPTIG